MIGYVHFGGRMGDKVRIDAIRSHLQARGAAFAEFELAHERPRVDIVRELVSPRGVSHLATKLFRDRAHPLLREINWGVEVDQWKASVAAGAARVATERAGVTVVLAEAFLAGLVAAELKERCGIPFVFDMHGAISQEAPLTGSSEYSAFATEAERRIVAAADVTIAASGVMADFVASAYGVARDRIVVIPNGSDVSSRQARYASPATIVFAGNLAPYENVVEFVRAAELAAADRGFTFWLMGDGVKREELLGYVNERYVDLLYWGRRRRQDALDICARAQIGFVGQAGDADLAAHSPHLIFCPIKLFDYASCGLPVIIPPGEWSPLVERHDIGVVAARPEAAAFLEAADALRDRATWQRKSANAREMVRAHCQWSQLLLPLEGVLESALRRG